MNTSNPNNLDIWNRLGKTDPKHAKGFKRAGGFSGTAVKPIYTEQKMTEVFGPAGKGWGMGEPTFQTVQGNEGQVAVYCTVMLWWDPDQDEKPGMRYQVYGVGGDMVVVKQSSGLRTDDEAFKKAFTDAVGNAMKHLGMSADVHMGLFDDSKYVREREAKERDDPQMAGNAPQAASEEVGDPTAKLIFPALQSELRGCATDVTLDNAWKRWLPVIVNWSETMQQNCHDVFSEMRRYLEEHSGDARAASRDVIEAELRAAVSLADLEERGNKFRDAFQKLGKDDKLHLSRVKAEIKNRIDQMGGKMPSFDNLDTSYPPKAAEPTLTHEQKVAAQK